ncbi:MAG: OmpA family protein, partial [Proteobacteria bacterium]|nr:OmpA family protein [Pseudomonadota bacterium]
PALQAAPAKPISNPPAARPPSQMAVAPSPRAPSPNGVLTRLVFPPGSADVGGPLAEQLDALARTMRTRDERLLLQAYAAGGSAGSASGSRRLSLARALEVRSYLIRQGLKSTRVDVRALGASDASGPADRVDVILLAR